MTFGAGFCKCQPQIHCYDIHKCRWNVLHSDERTQWTVQWCSSAQVAAPFTCSFKIVYIYQAFILLFHKALHPPSLFLSLSVHLSLFSFCGTPSRFPNLWSFPAVCRCWCFLLAIKEYNSVTLYILCCNPTFSDHFHTDAVVPSSDHCRTEAVLPPSHHIVSAMALSHRTYPSFISAISSRLGLSPKCVQLVMMWFR